MLEWKNDCPEYQWYLSVANDPEKRQDLPMASKDDDGFDIEPGELVCRLPANGTTSGSVGICGRTRSRSGSLRVHVRDSHFWVCYRIGGISNKRIEQVKEFYIDLQQQWTRNRERRLSAEIVDATANRATENDLGFNRGSQVDVTQSISQVEHSHSFASLAAGTSLGNPTQAIPQGEESYSFIPHAGSTYLHHTALYNRTGEQEYISVPPTTGFALGDQATCILEVEQLHGSTPYVTGTPHVTDIPYATNNPYAISY
ncbi:MAG: hypothetical protein GOMPHAMPRED_000387 [Gomphillus americanus]|uniref:Uncharacterized protein n=1 Tax=Gomphillus americanus TaxID=1940652 RepID=A0A8H3EE37_9LECA|nr:MAG: hypothetical protein GOMPHAMPRED_000387 [Gomphillus americanus]